LLTVFADLDHDGFIDSRAAVGESADQSTSYGIVPLIPYETATQFCHGEGFKLAGTTQPIRPAPLSIRFDSQLSRGIKLVLQVNPEVRGRVSLFCRRNGGWDSLGLAGI